MLVWLGSVFVSSISICVLFHRWFGVKLRRCFISIFGFPISASSYFGARLFANSIVLTSFFFFFIKFFVLLLRSPFWCWSLCCFDDILRSVGSDADSHQLWMDSGVLQIQWWRWEEWKPPGDRRDIARGRGMDGDLIALPLLSGDADANPKFGAGNEAKYPTHRLLFQMIDCRHHDNLKWLCSIKAIALMDSRRV